MLNSKAISMLLSIVVLTIAFNSCKEKSVQPSSPHQEAAGLVILLDTTVVFKVFDAKIDSNIANNFKVMSGAEQTYIVRFLSDDGKIMPSVEEEVRFAFALEDTSLAKIEIIEATNSKNTFKMKFSGLKQGNSNLSIRLDHEDHVDFTTPKFTLMVK